MEEISDIGKRDMRKFLFQGELFQSRSKDTVPALADQPAASAIPDDHQVVVTDRDAITGNHILLDDVLLKGFDLG